MNYVAVTLGAGGPACQTRLALWRAAATLARMTRERTLFDTCDPAAEAQADARAEADVREGRLISHDAVKRWLQSIGTDKPLPRPRVGD